MTHTPARIILLSAALMVATAPISDVASATTASGTHVYTQKDSGRSLTMSKGTKFKIRLKACEDCGNHWAFAHRPDSGILKLTHKTDVSSATPPAVGGINTVRWTYKAVGRGTTKIGLVERSASHHNKVIKRFSLSVTVHAGG